MELGIRRWRANFVDRTFAEALKIKTQGMEEGGKVKRKIYEAPVLGYR